MVQSGTHIKTLQNEFNVLLGTKVLGRHARFYESVDSTNVLAMQWANHSAPEGALVFAEHQTAGRGRHGRSWESVSSANLLFSMVLRPNLPPPSLGLVTIAASLAMAETIDLFAAPLTSSIKWPNDLLLDGKKCCGMLIESAISIQNRSSATPVVLGIGINLNQEHFSEPIAEKTTSLLLESGRHVPRMAFLARFLLRLETLYFTFTDEPSDHLLSSYQSRLAYMNERTTLRFAGKDEVVEGIIRGVTPTGALQMQTAAGMRLFHAGEVTSQNRDHEPEERGSFIESAPSRQDENSRNNRHKHID